MGLKDQKMRLFISYDTEDYGEFRIREIAQLLESQDSQIEKVYYWQRDSKLGESFTDYMKTRIKKSDAVLFFCSENSRNSKPVQKEIDYAEILEKQPVPIFDDRANIPEDIRVFRGLEFDSRNFIHFFRNLFIKLTGSEPKLELDIEDQAISSQEGWKRKYDMLISLGDLARAKNHYDSARSYYKKGKQIAHTEKLGAQWIEHTDKLLDGLRLVTDSGGEKLLKIEYNFINELKVSTGKSVSFTIKRDHIVSLCLDGMDLERLPDSISALNVLHTLEMDDNRLTSLPESFGELKQLRYLYLNNNQLSGFPHSITKLDRLRSLELGRNHIETIPDAIGNLESLFSLDLHSNEIQYLPSSIGSLPLLRELRLKNNAITDLPDSISQLKSLKELDLRNNDLEALPGSFCDLRMLRWLGLCRNRALTSSKPAKEVFDRLKTQGCKIIFSDCD